jgi:hypothetical protein
VVVLSVALGIGANTALFGAMNGLWFTTLRVDHPETLVRLKWAGKNDMGTDFSDYGFSGGVRSTFSYPMLEQLRQASAATLSDLAAGAPRSQMNLVVDGQAEIVRGFVASGNFFQMPRVPALVGRTILPEDDTALHRRSASSTKGSGSRLPAGAARRARRSDGGAPL